MEEKDLKNQKDGTTMENQTSNVDYEKKYNELKAMTDSLIEQLNNRKNQEDKVQEERNLFMMYKRMDYLFQILNIKDVFPEDFINKCINEIIEVLNFNNDESR